MIAERQLLSVHGLVARLAGARRDAFPARDISLDVAAGEAVGLVGETGAGKSLAARAMIGLLPPDGMVEAGTVHWDNDDLARTPPKAMRALRGREIALATRESATALDPLLTIGTQLIRIHRRQTGSARDAAREAVVEAMRRMGLAEPELLLKARPHALSHGTRQRVMIAMAIMCKPRLLILDDATTGLDATAQVEILIALASLRREHGMAVLLISNDIALAARLCDRLLVMYAGRLVETGPTDTILAAPRHPYTRALVGSIVQGTRRDGPLPAIRGEPVRLDAVPTGCAFQARCPDADPACLGLQTLRLVDEGRRVACWRATNVRPRS